MQPVTEVVEPHEWQLALLVTKHIFDGAEALVKLIKQRLGLGIICPLCHHIHAVEGEVVELCTQEVVLSRLTWYDVGQLQAISHSCGAIQTDTK